MKRKNDGFIAFFAVMIIYNLTCSFAHPVTPTVIKDLGLGDYMFGVAYAMMTIGNFLMSPFWGKLSEYISSRSILLISCIGYSLSQIWFAYATTELSIGIARFSAGVFLSGAFVCFLTYVINAAEPEDQPRFLTYSATINCVCGAFGYLIGGVIGEYSVRAAFWLQAVSLLFCGIGFFFACKPDAKKTERVTVKELVTDANPMKAFWDCRKFMNTAFLFLFSITVLLCFAYIGFDQAFNYYLKDQLELTSSYNGVIKSVVGLVSFVGNMTLCVWIINKTNTAKSMAVLLAISGTAAVGILLFPEMVPFMTFSMLIYGAYSVSLPVIQNMVATQASAEQKNLVMGFFNATKNLGSIAGSLIAGFAYSAHIMLPFACSVLVYAAGIAVAVGYVVYRRKNC